MRVQFEYWASLFVSSVTSLPSVAKVLALTALMFSACPSIAAYPHRPIRLLVPAAPPGPIAVLGRLKGSPLRHGLAGQGAPVGRVSGRCDGGRP